MIKVCYITHLSNLNGSSRSLLDLIDGLDRDIIKPYAVINSHGPIEEELVKRGVVVKRLFYSPSTNSDNKFKNIVKKTLNTPLLNKIAVVGLEKFFKKEKIDIIHNNNLLVSAGMEAAKKAKLPYVCHIREFLWEDHHRKLFYPLREKELVEHADYIIAISDAVKEKFASKISNSITVIPDGIKVEEYRLPLRKILMIKSCKILIAGRISPGKGQIDAIKAIKKVHEDGYNVELFVYGTIGDDDYYSKITKYIDDNKIDYVRIEHFVKDLKNIRKKCDIGLTCSSNEALGRVTIENMLSSMLVIGADSAGTSEIVSDKENGYLYRVGDYKQLAGEIEHAINNKDEANRIVKAGYEYATHKYDYKEYGTKMVDIYKKLI